MCTVTYLPIKAGEFILTSSRDEQTTRESASFPFVAQSEDYKLLYPKDGRAGGTWVAVSNKGVTICLLNGAFKKHIPSPPYNKSRGIVVLDAIRYTSIDIFIEQYNLEGIEPFTMVIIEHGTPKEHRVKELRWDGHDKFVTTKDILKKHIWSSATLYDVDTIQAREQWFDEWVQQNEDYTIAMSRGFHFKAGANDPSTNVLMNRNDKVKTVSVTTIAAYESKLKMLYQDTNHPDLLQEELVLS